MTVEYRGSDYSHISESDMCASLSKFRKNKKNVKAKTKMRPVKMAGEEEGLA